MPPLCPLGEEASCPGVPGIDDKGAGYFVMPALPSVVNQYPQETDEEGHDGDDVAYHAANRATESKGLSTGGNDPQAHERFSRCLTG